MQKSDVTHQYLGQIWNFPMFGVRDADWNSPGRFYQSGRSLAIPKDEIALVSGIVVRQDSAYVDFNTLHTTHEDL
jgi:hypothetical protein